MLLAQDAWRPTKVLRVVDVKATSTSPLFVETDQGNAVVKYLGNKAGTDALISEYICASLCNIIGVLCPDFAIMKIGDLEVEAGVTVQGGPAFLSRFVDEAYQLSPTLLKRLREPEQMTRLIVFDTWVRNSDRYCKDHYGDVLVDKPENALLIKDKRKMQLLAIDHSHALCDDSLEDGLGDSWVNEAEIYGFFPMFAPYLDRAVAYKALEAIRAIDEACIRLICERVPREWGMNQSLTSSLAQCLVARGARLADWLIDELFAQYELQLGGGR